MSARSWLTVASVLAGGSFAVWLLAPQLSDVPAGVVAITTAKPGWLAVAGVSAAAAFAAAALALQGATTARLHFGRTMQVQIAASAATIVAPAGLAGLALNVRFLERTGIPRPNAVAAVGLSRITAVVVHATTLVLLAPVVRGQLVEAALPAATPLLWGASGLATALALPVAVPRLRQRVSTTLLPMLADVRSVASAPGRLAALVCGAFLTSAARSMAFVACLRALGVPTPLLTVVALYLAAEAIGALGQTPGGIGLLDSTLLIGLSSLGVLTTTAVAALLVFRLLTFWLPVAPGALSLRLLQRAAVV